MGFSMHLMCFPGYYSVCLINILSFILKTLLGGRQQYASILHMENWGTGKLLKVVNVLSQSIFFKVLLSLKSAAAIDSEYSMVPSLLGNEQGEFGILGLCVALEDVMHRYTPTLLWWSHQSTASSALVLELVPVPLPSSPVTLQKSCSSFLRLSFQSQSLCSASPSSILLLLSSIVQTAQQPLVSSFHAGHQVYSSQVPNPHSSN